MAEPKGHLHTLAQSKGAWHLHKARSNYMASPKCTGPLVHHTNIDTLPLLARLIPSTLGERPKTKGKCPGGKAKDGVSGCQ